VTLALRPIGQNDYNVIEAGERIGRIRYASERSPVQVHIPGPPAGSARDLPTAKAEFKAAWEYFKARHGPERLAEAFKAHAHPRRRVTG
jgi:hypothetical protein